MVLKLRGTPQSDPGWLMNPSWAPALGQASSPEAGVAGTGQPLGIPTHHPLVSWVPYDGASSRARGTWVSKQDSCPPLHPPPRHFGKAIQSPKVGTGPDDQPHVLAGRSPGSMGSTSRSLTGADAAGDRQGTRLMPGLDTLGTGRQSLRVRHGSPPSKHPPAPEASLQAGGSRGLPLLTPQLRNQLAAL